MQRPQPWRGVHPQHENGQASSLSSSPAPRLAHSVTHHMRRAGGAPRAECVSLLCFLSGRRGHCTSMCPCANTTPHSILPSCPPPGPGQAQLRRAWPSWAMHCSAPTPATATLSWSSCYQTLHDSALPLSLPCRATPLHPTPGARRCTGPASPTGPCFVVSAFRVTATTNATLLSRGTEDCPWHPTALSERAKLEQDCRSRGSCSGDSGAGRQADRGTPNLVASSFPPHPSLCHVIEVTIPASLQIQHFVNLHRGQTQQMSSFFFLPV